MPSVDLQKWRSVLQTLRKSRWVIAVIVFLQWLRGESKVQGLPLAYDGSSQGAGPALVVLLEKGIFRRFLARCRACLTPAPSTGSPGSDCLIESAWTELLGAGAELLDLSWRNEGLKARTDKQFIWQTCSGPRGISSCSIYWCWPREELAHAAAKAADTVAGKTRLCAILTLGDTLNGHPGLIHGGFTSAVLDDLLGLTTWMEKEAQQLGSNSTIFTANLSVNYLKPLRDNARYLVEVEVERVVRSKKVFLRSKVFDREAVECVRAESLYIVKQLGPA